MRSYFILFISLSISMCSSVDAFAFYGLFASKSSALPQNKATKMVLVRHHNKTVLSLMNDFEGDLKDFALILPVPQTFKKNNIRVIEPELFNHIDAYSSPRFIEYTDSDPCRFYAMGGSSQNLKTFGVSVETKTTVGEYDLTLLSAKQSLGLEAWLIKKGYAVSKDLQSALEPFVQKKMKFLVAKVNLQEQAKTGLQTLRPLQITFESEKFELPIAIHSQSTQDLLLYIITEKGRVETTNVPTAKIPSNFALPESVKDSAADFYPALFKTTVENEKKPSVFMEYFWNMGTCDGCTAEPLSSQELKKLGVSWLKPELAHAAPQSQSPGALPAEPQHLISAYLTRLHLRSSGEGMPETLTFQESPDVQYFQGRYTIRHTWKGEPTECEGAKRYLDGIAKRKKTEVENLTHLTGWPPK